MTLVNRIIVIFFFLNFIIVESIDTVPSISMFTFIFIIMPYCVELLFEESIDIYSTTRNVIKIQILQNVVIDDKYNKMCSYRCR